ncbi:MAG: NADPH-dependent assimilatory sulfite reductase hemoprotein subunit [Chitinophagaceae bacterium]|nr:NADPH-dependent assimilatory sulfite reductase hemoprotein subunit [Chitinophagaceae bacterium]
MSDNEIPEVERIKRDSRHLRGTIAQGLLDTRTGGISDADKALLKFHGSYQQDDRDLRDERRRQKLEPDHQFMVRARLAGGVLTTQQWLAFDELATKYSSGSLRITTRQTFQLHGVQKQNLKKVIAGISQLQASTIAACGDVNRNVMSSANPFESPVHAEVTEDARRISAHLSPQTGAYHEIWLDKELIAGGETETEPIYGKVYMPRKFKIAIAIPPRNDTDVLSNDLGFIAIVENGVLKGYNLSVGGGMAYTFGNSNTFPRVADVVGYLPKEKIVEAAEAVLVFQRDHGNRSDRKNARLKYTIEKYGLDYFKSELLRTHKIELEVAKTYQFETQGDLYGWKQGVDGYWHYTLFVEGGKLTDLKGITTKTAVREIAQIHDGSFILTGNQNLVIAQVSQANKAKIEAILRKHQVVESNSISRLRQHSIACAALPYCGLSFAEAERYLPTVVDKIDVILKQLGLFEEPISIRMTGCPNGCGRPFLGEIALVGRAPGKYNLYLGASFRGDRLNKLYKEMLNEEEILSSLEALLTDYAQNRSDNERFGDFVIRKEYVKAVHHATEFHH